MIWSGREKHTLIIWYTLNCAKWYQRSSNPLGVVGKWSFLERWWFSWSCKVFHKEKKHYGPRKKLEQSPSNLKAQVSFWEEDYSEGWIEEVMWWSERWNCQGWKISSSCNPFCRHYLEVQKRLVHLQKVSCYCTTVQNSEVDAQQFVHFLLMTCHL